MAEHRMTMSFGMLLALAMADTPVQPQIAALTRQPLERCHTGRSSYRNVALPEENTWFSRKEESTMTVLSQPAVVYVSASDGAIHALRAGDGAQLWHTVLSPGIFVSSRSATTLFASTG